LDQNRPGEAEPAARAAIEVFAAARAADDEAAAREVLARVLLLRHQTEAARQVLAPAVERAGRSQKLALRVAVTLTDARLRAAAGDRASALRLVSDLMAAPHVAESGDLRLEARLAAAELRADRQALARVASDAAALGEQRIARRARALSSR